MRDEAMKAMYKAFKDGGGRTANVNERLWCGYDLNHFEDEIAIQRCPAILEVHQVFHCREGVLYPKSVKSNNGTGKNTYCESIPMARCDDVN